MALAPILCDKCSHRISPSEKISAIGNMIVGECCAEKGILIITPNPAPPPTSLSLAHDSDYLTFLNNSFIPISLESFRREIKHSGSEKTYISCLFRANPKATRDY